MTKKTNYLEIIGVLSLSLILTSAFSVSGCLPEMMEQFSSYSMSEVEFLLSVPSFAMLTMIALSSLIGRYVPERVVITTGLVLYGCAGIVPVFWHDSYPVLFASRILLGVGTGLINARAVTIIGERFTGTLQQKLQGIRCSMETLGQATLTLIAGQLLVYGWNYSFLIYSAAFGILLMYLFFVPAKKKDKNQDKKEKDAAKETLIETAKEALKEEIGQGKEQEASGFFHRRNLLFTLKYAMLGFLMISTNVANSLRVPTYVVEEGIGTAVQGSTILSLSIFAGFISGLLYGFIVEKLKSAVLPISLVCAAAGLVIMSNADSLFTMGAGACICGFFVTICLSYMFSRIPEELPTGVLNTANSVVLIGCNFGSSTAPFVLKMAGLINSELSFGFLAYGIIYVVLAVVIGAVLLVNKKRKN